MIGRPRRGRCIRGSARSNSYKPAGIPSAQLEQVTLSAEEVEALRLADLEGEGQAAGAERMGISQPTFHRELKSARQKVADALLNGKAITLTQKNNETHQETNGGETMPNNDGTGPEGKGPKTGCGMGNCPQTKTEEDAQRPSLKSGRGRGPCGQGRGRGMGRGRR